MGIVGELCRKITLLTTVQIEMLEKISGILDLAAGIANAQVTLYTCARDEDFLVIVAQAKPNTHVVKFRQNLLGTTVHISEEPMIWRTLQTGERIAGQREWALGMDALEMRTFPLYDAVGSIMAAVSFEASAEEAGINGYDILAETAYLLLTATDRPGSPAIYRPLSIRDGIIIIDERGQIIFANSAASSIYTALGVGRMTGRRIYDRQIKLRPAQQAINTGQPFESELETGNMFLVQRALPIREHNRTVRVVVIVSDVTEIRKKEKELLIKSAVIQEIHHRVKNNLQTIASLLRLQARRTKTPEVKAALRESVNRILSISVVHEFLSQQDAETIDVAEVAKNILDLVIQNMLEPDFNIQTVFNGPTIILPSDQATSLALVINELIQNSIEHGFVGRREGVIGVDIAILADSYKIEIYDNGIGLPQDFNGQASGSLGLQIVRTLIEEDLGGTFNLFSNEGTHACITIPRIMEGGQL